MYDYDVLILGGGPGGYSAAIQLSQNGKKVALIEKESLGGTCLNIGCIPTKSLLEHASVLEQIRYRIASGVLKDTGMFSWKKMMLKKQEHINQLVGGIKQLLDYHKVEVIKDEGTLIDQHTIKLSKGKKSFSAKKIIIATGSKVLMPDISGIEYCINSTDALNFKSLPKRLAIIGAGVIGVEMASLFNALGVDITVFEIADKILINEDKEISNALLKTLRSKGIKFNLESKVDKIKYEDNKTVYYTSDKDTSHQDFDEILVCIGRVPVTEKLNSKKLSIQLEKGIIITDKNGQTSLEGVYAIGDVASKLQLAHVAYKQADIVVEHILSNKDFDESYVVPQCTYCLPPVASVGYTEQQLSSLGFQYASSKGTFKGNGKAIVSEDDSGFVKILYDTKSGKILGGHILGNESIELISTLCVAIEKEISVNEISEIVFAHPTRSELIKETALKSNNRSVHII